MATPSAEGSPEDAAPPIGPLPGRGRVLAVAGVTALLAAGHFVSGVFALGAAGAAVGGGGFAGGLGVVLLGFLGLALWLMAGWAFASAARLVRGDVTARQPATAALIGFAILGVLTPIGAGPVAVAVPPRFTIWVQVAVVVLALAAITLLNVGRPRPVG